jgi:hypothetical protein
MIRSSLATALVTAIAVAAPSVSSAQQMIANGDFETGNLSGWSTSGLGLGGPCPISNRDWNVASNGATGTGCLNPSNPVGAYSAYNMMDGTGPLTYRLSQSFLVPTAVTSATLSFLDARTWGFGGEARTFTVELLNGATVIATPFTASMIGSGTTGGWAGHSFDVTSALQANEGATLTLSFSTYVPQTWSGAAGQGLDNVGLFVVAEQTPGTVTPEPVTMTLLGTGLAGVAAARRRRVAAKTAV